MRLAYGSTQVQDIAFSLDSRWVVVSTLNGTSHAFPISPYGGESTVRTHTSSKVVNRMSRFHTSAGMDSFMNLPPPVSVVAAPTSKSSQSHGQATPPSSSHSVGAVNGYNTWSNPRSLPLPNPIVTSALQQIKQPYQSLQGIVVVMMMMMMIVFSFLINSCCSLVSLSLSPMNSQHL